MLWEDLMHNHENPLVNGNKFATYIFLFRLYLSDRFESHYETQAPASRDNGRLSRVTTVNFRQELYFIPNLQ